MNAAAIVTRSFTPMPASVRLDTYRSARAAHRDDYEFTRAHREGCALQCMSPAQRREYLTARTPSPAPTGNAAQGLPPAVGFSQE